VSSQTSVRTHALSVPPTYTALSTVWPSRTASLFIGRDEVRKRVDVAARAAARTGYELVVAGEVVLLMPPHSGCCRKRS
jgi:hypothetical protein